MAGNTTEKTPTTPATAENREADFHSADTKTAEFWEKYWDRASTRIGVGRAMGEAWAQQDPEE